MQDNGCRQGIGFGEEQWQSIRHSFTTPEFEIDELVPKHSSGLKIVFVLDLSLSVQKQPAQSAEWYNTDNKNLINDFLDINGGTSDDLELLALSKKPTPRQLMIFRLYLELIQLLQIENVHCRITSVGENSFNVYPQNDSYFELTNEEVISAVKTVQTQQFKADYTDFSRLSKKLCTMLEDEYSYDRSKYSDYSVVVFSDFVNSLPEEAMNSLHTRADEYFSCVAKKNATMNVLPLSYSKSKLNRANDMVSAMKESYAKYGNTNLKVMNFYEKPSFLGAYKVSNESLVFYHNDDSCFCALRCSESCDVQLEINREVGDDIRHINFECYSTHSPGGKSMETLPIFSGVQFSLSDVGKGGFCCGDKIIVNCAGKDHGAFESIHFDFFRPKERIGARVKVLHIVLLSDPFRLFVVITIGLVFMLGIITLVVATNNCVKRKRRYRRIAQHGRNITAKAERQ